jgi:hypothetical protein
MVGEEDIRKKDNGKIRRKRKMDKMVGEEDIRKKDNGKIRKKR